jgi:signal transduction histidine kinase
MTDSPVQILIVDDSPEDRETYTRMLAADRVNCYRIREAELGAEGLAACAQEPTDCILLDYCLPDMDGLEFLHKLAEQALPIQPAILMLTGHGSEAVAVQAMKAGAQDYLVKGDMYRDELCVAVRNAIERVALGRRIEEQRRELEALAVERARLIDELAGANRHKDEFLAMLAHELRNMLAPLRNGVKLLQSPDLPPADLKWTRGIIDRQVNQVTRLVEDLLDVSRIAQGKLELRRKRVLLADAVREAVEASREEIEKGGHAVSVTVPTELLALDADPMRISQILVNLLHNAAKYTPRGGRIQVLAERQEQDAVIRVQDTGIGIPEHMLSQIFELFTQLDHASDQAGGGLGIGLTLVQRLVRLHGGVVEARSAGSNQGSEFIVRLPLAENLLGDSDSPRELSIGNPEPAGYRIMVVDDNRDAADSLAMLLRLQGHVLQVAYDGLHAIQVAEAFQPDVILMDLGLPKLDGYETAQRIRAGSARKTVIIALTGRGNDEDRRLCREAGFAGYTTKPVELEVLLKLLSSVIHGGKTVRG